MSARSIEPIRRGEPVQDSARALDRVSSRRSELKRRAARTRQAERMRGSSDARAGDAARLRAPSSLLVRTSAASRGGFAILTVLLVLLALLALLAPFLLTVRNADHASQELQDQAAARIALDTAVRHAQARLQATHAALDKTPYWDTQDELSVDNRFDASSSAANTPNAANPPRGANDPRGTMWDLDVRDAAGLIDLNSAPPALLANLLHRASALADQVTDAATEIPVVDASAFDASGFLWLRGEIVHYERKEGSTFQKLQRGLGATLDKDGNNDPCAPKPAQSHPRIVVAMDQSALAIPLWRLQGKGELRAFDGPEQARDAESLMLGGSWPLAAWRTLARFTTAYAGVRAGAEWQAPTRVTGDLVGGNDCLLLLENARWFNVGTTVRIDDGRASELGLVVEMTRGGGVRLARPVANSYKAWETSVQPLARRPVNLNSAPPEVLEALFAHVGLLRSRSRVGVAQAQRLARVVIASRPFTGFEDFLQRVVLPAAGLSALPKDAAVVPDDFASPDGTSAPTPIIDQDSAIALYRNGINANDAELSWSTLPYCFSSRDTFELDLRASVNRARPGDPAGAERASGRREQVELVVPQRELVTLWSRQEDFDEALRLSGDAPWWTSGPRATARWDEMFGSAPPPLTAAHLGGWAGDTSKLAPGTAPALVPTFASREDNGWAQPWVARQDESGQRQGRVVHFDFETRDPEGRYLPDETFIRPTNDKLVDWIDGAQLLRPIGFEAWIKPRGLKDGDLLFDLGGAQGFTDRVSLLVQGPDLVLRVLDAFGDHPDTSFREQGEVHWLLSNLPDDIWSHVAFDVRGTRADQIALFVDGMARPKTRGLTRLTNALAVGDTNIRVDSTEGFPDVCVLRIGNELIEAQVATSKSFLCVHQTVGNLAGRGGRRAREKRTLDGTGAIVDPFQDGQFVGHGAGTPVQLYGYSLDLKSDIAPGEARLTADVGNFALATVTGVVGGSPTAGDTITVAGVGVNTISFGNGMEGPSSQVSALELGPADPAMPLASVMSAFSSQGGYALVCQQKVDLIDQVSGQVIDTSVTQKGAPLFGLEVIRYSGVANNRLLIAKRGVTVQELPSLAAVAPNGPSFGGAHAFVTKWGGNMADAIGMNADLGLRVYVMPISIAVSGGNTLMFQSAIAGKSNVAQLTHTDALADKTEWVRYDDVVFGSTTYLVRSNGLFLQRALIAAALDKKNKQWGAKPSGTGGGGVGGPGGGGGGIGGPGGGGGGFGSGGGGGGGPFAPDLTPEPDPELALFDPAPPLQASGSTSTSPTWSPLLGSFESTSAGGAWDQYLQTKAVWSTLQFRGVLGTVPHAHTAGTVVVPTFRMRDGGPNSGLPGRLDRVHVQDGDPSSVAWPVTIQHAHRPFQYAVYHWAASSDGKTAQVGATDIYSYTSGNLLDLGLDAQAIWVGFTGAVPALIPHGSPSSAPTGQPVTDSRFVARMALFPSGERPRLAPTVKIGGSVVTTSGGLGATASAGAVPAAVVDELVFGSTTFGQAAGSSVALGAQMIAATPLPAGPGGFQVADNVLRVPNGELVKPAVANELPEDAGLLRIGGEIVCYMNRDPLTGVIAIAPGGRGLLGTEEENHEVGEAVAFLSHRTVSRLAEDVKASNALLRLASADEFPAAGTALVGAELVHWTRQRDSGLEMPLASNTPGAHDQRGSPLFRGRYGTQPDAHLADTPVIQFPYRYWDRWAERADEPELAYFAFCADQPGALWKDAFWQDEAARAPGPHIGVLMRADRAVPWDSEPADDGPLRLQWQGMREGNPHALGVVADRMEFRAFVKHEPASFDFAGGLSHGWKVVPRLRLLGTRSYAPGRTLRRVGE